jgi:glycosyltransferase involved in cell wall biosynthesis
VSKQLFSIDVFKAQPLPTEDEVIVNWQGDIDKPLVSVLCNTFNQANYIEDAFRGFLLQKTNFVFEVIVHDDASTDGTSDIVREYAKQYPKIFKPVIQIENQYSQGKKPTLLSSAHATGEYLALCEGDDFWVDENKLANQYKLALEHKAGLVFSSCYRLSKHKLWISHEYSKVVHNEVDVIKAKMRFAPTASYFFPKSVIDNLPHWFSSEAPFGDFFIELYSNKFGVLVYYDNPSVLNRVQAKNSWSSANKKDITGERAIYQTTAFVSCLKMMKKDCFFEKCDFSFLLFNSFYGMALGYLRKKEFSLFLKAMKESASYNKKNNKMFLLFSKLKQFPRLCRLLHLTAMKFKKV